jgi:hypothetical protein
MSAPHIKIPKPPCKVIELLPFDERALELPPMPGRRV